MPAELTDIPSLVNWFANDDQTSQDLRAGTLHAQDGSRLVALSDDFLVGMVNVLENGLGRGAESVMKEIGRDWGVRAGEQFDSEMVQHKGMSVADIPLAWLKADLVASFQRNGWGTINVDFGRYAHGVLGVEVCDPVMGSIVKPTVRRQESLLCGFLAGLFSHLAGVELDCLQTECRGMGASRSRFLLTIPERVRAILGEGLATRNHAEILEALESTRVNA